MTLYQKLLAKLEVKHTQYLLAFGIGAIFLILIFILIRQIGGYPTKEQPVEKSETVLKRIESAVSRTDPQETWRFEMQKEKNKILEEVESIKKTLAASIEEKQEQIVNHELEDIKAELSNLREFVSNVTSNNVMPQSQQVLEPEVPTSIEKIVISLDENKSERSKNIEDTIPAGAFAKAIILGGVDASTTLNAQGDPRPMLIRLIDMGSLPRRFKSDLEDCHIVSSSYGDLSSERVYARLEKLTCIERNTGEIIETEVAGYIAGEDGRVGVRGMVVEKGQKYLTNSLVGGVLQGVAGVITPQQQMLASPLIGAGITQKESNQDRFERGFGAGVSGGMDRLSKYYIERAEKLQPVIQVGAGRVVDVVFTEGTAIGTEQVRKHLEEKRIKQQSMEGGQ